MNNREKKTAITLNHPFRMVIVGTSGSGKSYFAKHLIQNVLPVYDFVFVFSSTIHDGGYDYIESDFKFPALKPYHVITIRNHLTKIKQLGLRSRSLILLDDSATIESNKRTRYSAAFDDIFTHVSRHLNIDLIACYQNTVQISTTVRSNLTHLVIFRIPLERNRKALRDFMSNLLSDEELKGEKPEVFIDRYVNENTGGYRCIVIDFSKYNWSEAVCCYKV